MFFSRLSSCSDEGLFGGGNVLHPLHDETVLFAPRGVRRLLVSAVNVFSFNSVTGLLFHYILSLDS